MFLPHIDFRFRLLGGVIIMKKSFWVPFLALAGSLIFSITALAGEVNSAEQKIVDAISGTYEYDGAQYRVTDAYIAKVANYLSRDDVNMTESEARGYIRQFNENIAVGISSGYMVKVDHRGTGGHGPLQQLHQRHQRLGRGIARDGGAVRGQTVHGRTIHQVVPKEPGGRP